MEKRGQLLDHPFVLIFGLLVGILILVIGFRWIAGLKSTVDQVQVVDFVTSLRQDVDTYYFLDVGSIRKKTISLPVKVKKVCFTHERITFSPITSFETATFNIKNLQPRQGGVLCVENSEYFFIIAQGDYVEVAKEVVQGPVAPGSVPPSITSITNGGCSQDVPQDVCTFLATIYPGSS